MREVPDWAGLDRIEVVRSGLPSEVVAPLLKPYLGCSLVCENLQVTGSYKIRAVCHCLGLRRSSERVALASSGNFAVALAWGGRRLGIPTTAVMMRRSQAWKVERVRALGGEVLFCGNSTEERTRALQELSAQGTDVIDHLVDPQVLLGHSTLGWDIARMGRPRQVLIPASTGGLLAACALALKQIYPEVRVLGVQPRGANALAQSFRAGRLLRLSEVVTECDALTANSPGELPWQIISQWVDDVVEVDEVEIRQAVLELLEEAKLLVEPGAAVGLAALRSGHVESSSDTWVLLSGGNLDPRRLRDWLPSESRS